MAFLATPAWAQSRADAKMKAIGWTGTAHVEAAGRILDLGVETRVEPFVRARSTSWIIEKGRETARTLLIEPDGGWVERNGERTALPEPKVRHEREQYALYGYMLKALRRQAPDSFKFSYEQQGMPGIVLGFASGRLATARYDVDGPEGGTVKQQITFGEPIPNQQLRWPRTIDIAQDGKPYFKLTIENFTLELA